LGLCLLHGWDLSQTLLGLFGLPGHKCSHTRNWFCHCRISSSPTRPQRGPRILTLINEIFPNTGERGNDNLSTPLYHSTLYCDNNSDNNATKTGSKNQQYSTSKNGRGKYNSMTQRARGDKLGSERYTRCSSVAPKSSRTIWWERGRR
jgi:hypothetical protein